jgi:AcrR family transcriptional regulator
MRDGMQVANSRPIRAVQRAPKASAPGYAVGMAERSRAAVPNDVVVDDKARRGTPVYKRGVKTRERVIAAATAVFSRQGYVGTTMQDIATEAGVASGTAYRYFTDKAELFLYVLADLVDTLHRETRMPADENGRLKVYGAIKNYLRVYRAHAGIYRVWWEVLEPPTEFTRIWLDLHAKSHREMVRVFTKGLAAGIIDKELDTVLVEDLILAMFDRPPYLRIVMGWDDELSDDIMASIMSRFLGRGSADRVPIEQPAG